MSSRFVFIFAITVLVGSYEAKAGYVHNDPINLIDPTGECSTDSDGNRSGVCPNDAGGEQLIDSVNSVDGYTELSDLDSSLESQGRLITVSTTDGENGSLTVSSIVGDSLARATVGTETSQGMGTSEPGGELGFIDITAQDRLVHEVVGHGGDWNELGTQAYIEMDPGPIGANDLGLHPSVRGTEAGPLAAENRFRAAQGRPERRTRYDGAIVTAPRQ